MSSEVYFLAAIAAAVGGFSLAIYDIFRKKDPPHPELMNVVIPDWATYVARESSGEWWAYSHEPTYTVVGNTSWFSSNPNNANDWWDTLNVIGTKNSPLMLKL